MRKTLPNSIFLSVCLFDLGFHLNSRFALEWNLFVSNFSISPRVRHIEMCSTLKCGHFHNIVPSLLFKELQKFYKNKKVVVFWGPKLRLPGKGKGAHQEFDFVIIDMVLKAVIGIESNAEWQDGSPVR